MIEIKQTNNAIMVEGHANYAPIGKDIVCSAISSLVQTLIRSIEKLTEDKIEYDMQPGKVHIKHGDLSDSAKLLINSFFIGAKMIAENYPENVQVKNDG